MKAHVAERDEILAECEPTESQVVTQESMFEEENNQSYCAGD